VNIYKYILLSNKPYAFEKRLVALSNSTDWSLSSRVELSNYLQKWVNSGCNKCVSSRFLGGARFSSP